MSEIESTQRIPLRHAKNKFITTLIVVFSAIGGILFGYDCGLINGMQQMKDWLRTFGYPTDDLDNYPLGYRLSSPMQSLVVSILFIGTITGSLASAPFADIIGRKLAIVSAAAVFSVGVAMQLLPTSIGTFITGRFLGGLGVGAVSCVVPMYQSECSPKNVRGAVVSTYLFFVAVGFLLAAIANNATNQIDNHSAWQIPVSIQFVWAVILSSGMFALPESPAYLIKCAKSDAALQSLTRLTGLPPDHEQVQRQFEEIRHNLEQRRAEGTANTYADCFKKSTNKIALRTWTGMGIQTCSMLTGVNYITTYSTTIFQSAHLDNPSPFMAVIILNLVQLIMSSFGVWAIEHFGRRPLLLVGTLGITVCSFAIAIISVSVPTDNMGGVKATIVLVFFYIAFWSGSWANTSWVLPGEILPLEIRAKALSLATACSWFWGFLVIFVAPYLTNVGDDSAGLGNKIFFIWGCTCLVTLVFTYFFVPETQGLSLEQIDMMYEASKSIRYRAGVPSSIPIQLAPPTNS